MHLGGRVPENQEGGIGYWELHSGNTPTVGPIGSGGNRVSSLSPSAVCCPPGVVGQPAYSKMLSLPIQLEPNPCCISSGLGWDVHPSMAHSR